MPNVLNARCGSQQVLDIVADKWTAAVISLLSKGTKRCTELQRETEGVSQEMLTQTLRNPEGDGLVRRTGFPVVPPRVEHVLTPLGQDLVEPLCGLCEWAESHLEEVEEARARYRSANPVGRDSDAP
jgi:DNA-binding HxlR family transcriptional regulator